MASYLAKKKDYTNAAKIYATSLKLADTVYGEGSREAASIHVDLSKLYRNCGRAEEAAQSLQKANKLYYSLAGVSRTGKDYIKFLLYSAKCYASRSDKQQAEQLLMESIRLVENRPDSAKLL